MTRDEFIQRYAPSMSNDAVNALETLLDDYDVAMGGAYELLSDMPTCLEDVLDDETMAAYRGLCERRAE